MVKGLVDIEDMKPENGGSIRAGGVEIAPAPAPIVDPLLSFFSAYLVTKPEQ
jgi:hypothetical protein